ncbi:MAG: hypothetical protein K8R56_06250 [Candidatus Eisenbacteria bacterium]|nr:hypothetical protein [Candidatus Eisenbacteria bacterium]
MSPATPRGPRHAARATALRLATRSLARLALLAAPAHALRLVNMNVLNYPGTTAATRDPLFRTILQAIAPDVLITCEMVNATGPTQFLASLNTMEPGQWAASSYTNGGDTASELFYKPSKVELLGQWNFYPNPAQPLRFVHVYRLRLVGYGTSQAEFRIYGLHLKASTGFETQRLNECIGLRDSLNAMPPGTHALVCGDFNFYTGLEPGMQKLVESQVNNVGRLYDVLGLEGIAWQDNTTMQYAWTQSPCKTGDTGCASGAATGGLDDRFDLILPSAPWKDGAGLEIIPGTYISVGNDGLHHNNSIMDPPTIPEGAAFAAALHGTADHLPLRVDLRVPALAQATSAPMAFGTVITGANASLVRTVLNAAALPGESLLYTWLATPGFGAPIGTQSVAAGGSQNDAITLDTSTPGAKLGTLAFTSNTAGAPVATANLSGTVLRHAVPSLDSAAVLAAGSIDFGTHEAGSFVPAEVRVHNQGHTALQAQLHVTGASITGGDGHFAVSGATPQVLGSTYTATLTFASQDEPLPGATAAGPLTVSLSARRQSSATTDAGAQRPVVTLLRAPAPNPLVSESVLRFELAQAGEARLDVFDAAGRRVAQLLRTSLEPGRYSVRFDGRGESGAPLGAGLYFARLTAAGHAHTVRLAIVR